MMRPVATHDKQITDYNTWNGLLVMSGVRMDAAPSIRVIKNDSVALWVGGIDDLWKFGKPVGEGGVWNNTIVNSGERSDWYLMTGYDKKTVEILADRDVEITFFVNVSHYTDRMVPYQTYEVKAGETVKHSFPEGYSAHWIAAETNKKCKATVWFSYQ